MQEDFSVQLERAKLDAMKELAYGASHEINNPLANIAARAQSLLRDEANPERSRALEAIYEQAMRAHEMISDLMLFARPPKLEIQQLDFTALLQELTEKFSADYSERNILYQLKVPPTPVEIAGDRQQLFVAISALLTNAMEAVGRDGRVAVSLGQHASHISLEVSDTGLGLSDEVRKHLFDPFYSGREAGRGLGFGLSKCWRIVTDHRGTIVVGSTPQEGACFSITFPTQPKSLV